MKEKHYLLHSFFILIFFLSHSIFFLGGVFFSIFFFDHKVSIFLYPSNEVNILVFAFFTGEIDNMNLHFFENTIAYH